MDVIYLKSIADQVHPFMAAVFSKGSIVFQQDNALSLTAKKVQKKCLRSMTNSKMLTSTPDSLDLSQIEHLWDVLEKLVLSKDLMLMFCMTGCFGSVGWTYRIVCK